MHAPGIDSVEAGPPPLRRAVVGLGLGLVAGVLAAVLLPREPRGASPGAVVLPRPPSDLLPR